MHDHAEHEPRPSESKSFWRTPLGWAFLGFAAIAGFFLVTEHAAHTIAFLPWLLLLACPLMHIFMHRGHGHGGHRHDHGKAENSGARDAPQAPRDR